MTFAIAAAAFAAILIRPFKLNEAWWACGGALALIVLGSIPLRSAWGAVLRGVDVYLFLLGMMLIAEVLRAEGVFARLAALALRAAGSSQARLFALVFGAGAAVTVFFSNDATAVVLTPAVAALAARARVSPYPYLYSCAFIANAASFVLPISNPANLVVFDGGLPRLGPWLGAFWLPSLVSIGLTFTLLRVGHASRLQTRIDNASDAPALAAPARAERVALAACSCAALGLVAASFAGFPLGLCTFVLALAAFGAVLCADSGAVRTVLPGVNYAIVALVGGLFVIVEALDRAGALTPMRAGLGQAAALARPLDALSAGAAIALACNVLNNLPVALGVASTFGAHAGQAPGLRDAALVAVDLGPNLAVSGSLATLLWMDALRREDVPMDAPRFLRSGLAVGLPALLAALAAVG